MENAAKALTIAGAVLITIMVISALIFAYRDIAGVKEQESENQKTEEIINFNKSYESYEKELYGTELISLANKMYDYNVRVAGKDGYEKIQLIVGSDTNAIDTYRKIQQDVDSLWATYKSSNYLEELYNAKYSGKKSGTYQMQQIFDKIGITNDVPKISNIINNKLDSDYEIYKKYKELKTKRFKCNGTTYYSNGRIETMTFSEK